MPRTFTKSLFIYLIKNSSIILNKRFFNKKKFRDPIILKLRMAGNGFLFWELYFKGAQAGVKYYILNIR